MLIIGIFRSMKKIPMILKRIKAARLDKGYTQDYMAYQLKISQISYYKIESGKTELKVKTILELAKILEVAESYLLGCASK